MDENRDFASMTMDELRAVAADYGVKVNRGTSKGDIIAAIEAASNIVVPIPDVPTRPTEFVTVRVNDECPYDTIRSAGLNWSRQPVKMRRDATMMGELQANPWLTVEDAEE